MALTFNNRADPRRICWRQRRIGNIAQYAVAGVDGAKAPFPYIFYVLVVWRVSMVVVLAVLASIVVSYHHGRE